MLVKCRFSSCQWSGSSDDIFSHCETYHSHYIREHKCRNYYEFHFDDLERDCFLLSGKNGLYWFCLNPKPPLINGEEGLQRGVFHIGESESIEYKLVLGSIREGHKEYMGPYKSQRETNDIDEIYNLTFTYEYLEFMNEVMPSRQMRLYVGEFDDSDDVYWPQSHEMTWTDEDEEINTLCLERFTCPICLEYIRKDVRFCENQHFVCLKCFNSMQERRKLRCPICRGDYLYDCYDERIERLLRMVKWPERDADNQVLDGPTTSSAKRFKTS